MSEEAQAAASHASRQPEAAAAAAAAALSPDTAAKPLNNQMTEGGEVGGGAGAGAGAGGKWSCEVCTYENYPLSKKCTMCRSQKPVLGEDIFKLQDGASALPCDRERDRDRDHDRDRAFTLEPTGAEGVTERLKPLRISSPQSQGQSSSCSVNKWPCPTCTYENWPRSLKCAMCGAPPPAAPAPPAAAAPAPPPPPSHAANKPAIGINEICNSVSATETEARRSTKRNTTPTTPNIDWIWLQACLGVVEGSPERLQAYLSAGGDPARALTAHEVALLDRASAFDAGHTLVHLAIRFRRQEMLAQLLAAVSGSGPGLKREPSYIAADLAGAVRRHLAASLRRGAGALPVRHLAEFRTHALPAGVHALPPAVRAQLRAELLDLEAQATLEREAGVRRLYALWNRSGGSCLADAVAQAAYGVCDRGDALRHALAESLAAAARAFRPRWAAAERRAARALHYAPSEAQLRAEWARLVAAPQRPRLPLHQLHVWVLAHVMRRPLLVYGVDVVRSFRGEALGYAGFQGVYLPLLWEPAFCSKSPLVLGYTRGHFSALVPMEPPYEPDPYICGGEAGREENEEEGGGLALPLADLEGKPLPVHFLTNEEARDPESVLRRWLQLTACAPDEDGAGAPLAARQALHPRHLLQAQMLEEWLNHYRRLAQQMRGPFPPRLHAHAHAHDYSDPDTEEE